MTNTKSIQVILMVNLIGIVLGYGLVAAQQVDSVPRELEWSKNEFHETQYAWTRDDTRAPVVTDTQPQVDEERVTLDAPIIIVIDDVSVVGQPAPSGVNPDTIQLLVNGTSVVFEREQTGSYGYTITWRHEEAFSIFEFVTVEVSGCDFANNCMEPYVFSFTTGGFFSDKHSPSAINPSPLDGTTNVALNTPITVRITEYIPQVGENEEITGVDPDSVIMRINGQPVAIELEPFIFFGFDVYYNHEESPFEYNATIIVEVEASDFGGNAMPVYSWSFETIRTTVDTEPPVFSRLFPESGATDVSVFTVISATITDELSEIETSSISIGINGNSVTGIIDTISIPDGIIFTFTPSLPFSAGQEVVIQISVPDHAMNIAQATWRFTIATSLKPKVFYPSNDAWLHYAIEEGLFRLQWINSPTSQAFRIRLFLPGESTPFLLDVDGASFRTDNTLFTLEYLLDITSWDMAADVGTITWDIAQISMINGNLLTDFSTPSTFTFASSESLALRKPLDYSILRDSSAPKLEWDMSSSATSYLLGFVRVSQNGSFTDDIFTVVLDGEVNSLELPKSSWDIMSQGYWLWSVIPLDTEQQYGKFMLSHFTKIFK